MKDELKRMLAENSLDHKDDVLPINYNARSCIDILQTALLSPTSDDAKRFWNKDTEKNNVV